MRIGIFTIHASYNYGAMLQAFATQKVIEKLGHKVEIIDYYPKDMERSNKGIAKPFSIKSLLSRFLPKVYRKNSRFLSFRARMNLTKRFLVRGELYKNPPFFDLYILGSDQMWNMQQTIDPFYFFDFIPKGRRKISYAASFGTEIIPPNGRKQLSALLSDFSTLSCREKDGVQIIKKYAKRDAIHVLDPTFLLDINEWLKYSFPIKYSSKCNNGFILCYGLVNKKHYYRELGKRFNLPVIAIWNGLFCRLNFDDVIYDAGPSEFLYLINKATAVYTGSFHGCALAINFKKPLFVESHPTRNSRMVSLLGKLGMMDRFIMEDNYKSISLEHDYSLSLPLLENEIKISEDFIYENCKK